MNPESEIPVPPAPGGTQPGGPPPGASGPPAPTPPPASESVSAEPSRTHRRTGAVAQLPKRIRDQICEMLLDGFTYKRVIESLGEDGKDLNVDNIGSWHDGGYKDWYEERLRKEALGSTRDKALDLLKEKAGEPVQDAGRTVAAAQLYELLLSFDPTSFAAALAEKPELYLRLVNALARLCEGGAACGHHRAQESLLAAKLKPDEPLPKDKLLDADQLKDLTHQIKLI